VCKLPATPLQYSVFRCDLTDRRRIELTRRCTILIGNDTDQVLRIDLGPVDGRASICVSSIGRAYGTPERSSSGVIVCALAIE
jgi:CRISPR-associated protein Cas2